MAFAEDHADFINADTPGAKPCTINGNSVYGLFDNGYADALGIAGRDPALLVIESQVGALSIGLAITVDAAAYTVVGIEPDGTGITRLQLEAA